MKKRVHIQLEQGGQGMEAQLINMPQKFDKGVEKTAVSYTVKKDQDHGKSNIQNLLGHKV